MSKAMAIRLVFGITIVMVVGIFYFVIIQGGCDQFLLKKINEKAPITLKWKGRIFLTFRELEIIKDDRYFYSPKVVINLEPYLNLRGKYPKTSGRMEALVSLQFQGGYASQGKRVVIKDISGEVPLKFIWPNTLYPLGYGYLKCGEVKLNKLIVLRPRINIIANNKILLIKRLEAELLQSPVWASGKIDIEKNYFTLSTIFDRIDLEALAGEIKSERFGGRGKWGGNFNLDYQEGHMNRGGGEFKLVSQGGELKAVFLKDLIQRMPEGEAKNRLLQGLGGHEYFSFYNGDLNIDVKGEDIKIRLVLEGKNGLFDFNINLPIGLAERFCKKSFLYR